MDNVHTLIEKLKAEIEDGKSAEEIFEFLKPFLGRHEETDVQVACPCYRGSSGCREAPRPDVNRRRFEEACEDR